MKRSDIRKSTISIMCFTVVAFIAMTVARITPEPVQKEEKEATVVWSDTLDNASSDTEALHGMDREIERFKDKWEIKGLSLAITRHDSLLYAKGYGWADEEAAVRMSPKSIMRIASASKLITAVAVMKLCEQGKLSLDSKVFGDGGILNDTAYSNSMRDPRMADITIDHLLQHKGGFTLGAGDPMFNTVDIMDAKHLASPPTNEELVKIVLGRRLGFTPGSGRRYSNFGYMVLSLVIEKVTRQTYWDYVRGKILEPCGAYDFRPATNYYGERHREETKYYGPDTVKIREYNGSGRLVDRVYGGSNVTGLLGAGGWVTSAAGLARVVASIDGDPGVKDILSAESIGKMTYRDDDDKQTRGWSESDGHGKWTRTGTLSSSHALVIRFADGECWVMTTNSGVWTGHNFSRDMERLIDRLRSNYKDSFPRRNLW